MRYALFTLCAYKLERNLLRILNRQGNKESNGPKQVMGNSTSGSNPKSSRLLSIVLSFKNQNFS